MKSKIFLLAILSIFLFNSVAAVTTYASWSDGTQTLTINNGDSASFSADFFAMKPPMNTKIILYDSSDNTVYTFLDQQTSTKEYSGSYVISNNIYKNAGDFTVMIVGTDANSAQSYQLNLKVNSITPADTTAPVITLLGQNPETIIVGGTYTEAGATATDNVDGDLTSKISVSGNINTGVVGTYTITYTVSDAAGNVATATRTVNVVANNTNTDTTAPTIVIQSPTAGTTYNSLSQTLNFIASDSNLNSCAYSTDNGVTKTTTSCTSGVLRSLTLNAVQGANTWIVYATDDAGNSNSASVTFNVNTSIADTIPPVITILNPSQNEKIKSSRTTIEVATDEDATVTFRLDNGQTKTMANPYDHVFTYDLSNLDNGDHTVVFLAVDTAGNQATKSVTFSVSKTSGGSGAGEIVSYGSSQQSAKVTSKSTGAIVSNVPKQNASVENLLYLFIATTGLGIAVVSTALFKKVKAMKK